MARSPHRSGRRYQQARAEMFAVYGTVCIHCGHDGAFEADHLMPISLDPDQPVEAEGMRPAHGANYPCPVCLRRCNQERSNRVDFVMFRPAIDW